MSPEIVQYHDVARPQGGDKDVGHIGQEHLPVRGRVDAHAGRAPVRPDRRDHRPDTPVPVRRAVAGALPPHRAPAQPGHVRFRAGLVDENKALELPAL